MLFAHYLLIRKERRLLSVAEATGSCAEAFLIKVDIVNNVAERTGVSKVKAEEAVEALFEAMKGALQRGERIELRGFGVFVVKPRKRGVGRNPRTGEVTDIPPGKTIRFKPGKELQQ
jgi:DNA-binding protein HU-beta